jgi:hypothetical protein
MALSTKIPNRRHLEPSQKSENLALRSSSLILSKLQLGDHVRVMIGATISMVFELITTTWLEWPCEKNH